jgi:hypothetical protein
MNTKTGASGIKRLLKKIMWIVTLSVILIFSIFIYWKYFFTYSDGYRAGLLQKFSHKGNIFKTYEGEIILSSVTSSRNVALASEKFLFSVKDAQLASKLDTLQGQFVIIHYTQKHSPLPWRGESVYLVDSAKVKN